MALPGRAFILSYARTYWRIVTLTLNPAVDVACTAPAVRPTHKIRTFDERLDAGGGGINVARVMRVLDEKPLALIATGGVTGRLVEELLDEAGVSWRSLPIMGRTRVSLNVYDRQTGLEYRFVPEGPFIAPDELGRFRDLLLDIKTEWLIASGSLPPGVPADFYAGIAELATSRGQKFVLDTSGDALRSAVGHGIYLLKLSLSEFQFLVGKQISDPIEEEQEARALAQSGAARLIAVSMGAAGAILATETSVFRHPGVKVKAESAVGAGDSFLAALVTGLSRQMALNDALAFGVAAGTASILRRGTAVVNRHEVDQLMSQCLFDEGRRSKT